MMIKNRIKIKLKLFKIYLKRVFNTEFRKQNLSFKFGSHFNSISNYTILKFLSDDYENEELFLAKMSVKDGDKILELGSGLGFVSMTISKNVNCNIVSYDVNKYLTKLNTSNSKLNNLKSIEYRFGSLVSDNSLSKKFLVSNEILKSSFDERNFVATDLNFSENVPCYSFNEICKQESPNYLIIDIEGFESEIFNDNSIIDFDSIDTILIEFHPNIYGEKEKQNLIKFLSNHFFNIHSSVKEVYLFKK